MMDARELVRAFVKERLGGNFSDFATFDFRQLKDDAKYGNVPGQNFDCDDTQLAKAVYVLVWGNVFPDLTLPNIGRSKKYRGDTMNTFHTVFGREIPGNPGHYRGRESYRPNETIRQIAREFQRMVSNLGNFVVLPNRQDKDRQTINLYRGGHDVWHDFFDSFLKGLEDTLLERPEQDAGLTNLVRNCNADAFREYFQPDGFARLVHALFLEDYVDSDGHAKRSLGIVDGQAIHHWMDPRLPAEKYFAEAERYVTTATAIIRRRAAKVMEALEGEI